MCVCVWGGSFTLTNIRLSKKKCVADNVVETCICISRHKLNFSTLNICFIQCTQKPWAKARHFIRSSWVMGGGGWLSDLAWCWTALPSTLFSSHIISVPGPQQTVTLHLMLWKWRGGGASPRCMTEAETRVRADRNKDRHGLSRGGICGADLRAQVWALQGFVAVTGQITEWPFL